MNALEKARIAIVVDALAVMGGAERVLDTALEVVPQADIYTLVYRPEPFRETRLANHAIHTSFVDRLPGAGSHYRSYLPLLPLAIEQFDLHSYELVFSLSYAVAHGILPRPGQSHISYTHTPLRQAWQHYHDFIKRTSLRSRLRTWLARPIMHYLRLWDFAAAARVDHFLAASRWVAQAVWRAYRREAQVLYPPVDIAGFQSLQPKEPYFITVSRLEPHKRVDLVVGTFSRLGLPLVVVGEGSEQRRLERLAGSTVQFKGWLPDSEVRRLVGHANAFVLAGEEDFSIAAVEAQAAGCPVIAYASGGVCETILPGETGLFFEHQSVECLADSVHEFQRRRSAFDPAHLQQNAARFSSERFKDSLKEILLQQWNRTQE